MRAIDSQFILTVTEVSGNPGIRVERAESEEEVEKGSCSAIKRRPTAEEKPGRAAMV